MQATFVNSAHFVAELDRETQAFDTGMQQVFRITEHDHTKLTGRDQPDQHPMGAITGLDTSLGAKVSAADALTNLEIEALLGGI